MTIKERYARIIERFERKMPTPTTELEFGSPFQLLVAVILSAQCTDKRVNMVTPALFEAFPTPGAMAHATPDDILPFIRSVSYPNNKAKALAGMARRLVDDFGSDLPATIDDLMTLPGVGRKTANVILAVVFGQSAMAVDTHVFRVSERLGLTTGSRTPLATERALMANIPADIVPRAHHWLILHGRYICKARKPLCNDCFLADICRHHLKNLPKEQ
ncbi:MAG: endonuclease III [Pseudoflavonifractor sp.]|nr:endonuclease III [Alloprevotella sp.]MCM1116048.1 endonuclease III [Pseudoflavonifractor sp.]